MQDDEEVDEYGYGSPNDDALPDDAAPDVGDEQRDNYPPQSAGLKGKVQVKGTLHIHRADGSIEDRPFVGYIDPNQPVPQPDEDFNPPK